MKIQWIASLSLIISLLSMPGCISAQVLKSSEPHIRLSTSGCLYVGETETSLKKLPKQLKQSKIEKRDKILIEIPEKSSPESLRAISRVLASNGYRRFMFSKPRKATVEKGEDPLLKGLQK